MTLARLIEIDNEIEMLIDSNGGAINISEKARNELIERRFGVRIGQLVKFDLVAPGGKPLTYEGYLVSAIVSNGPDGSYVEKVELRDGIKYSQTYRNGRAFQNTVIDPGFGGPVGVLSPEEFQKGRAQAMTSSKGFGGRR